MPAVAVAGLEIRYGEVRAVDGVSFAADAGEIVAVLGPNGAGKTSTIEALEGYRRPAAGTVRVLDLDPARDRAALTPRIGVMLQDGGVYPSMSARDAARLFASYYPVPLAPDDALERVGITGRVAATPWRSLSGGEKQRVSLALALLPRPEVVFLDEPTAGVDAGGRVAIREVVRGLRDDGACVVLTTHELDEAERLADRVVIVDHGKVVADGTIDELRSSATTSGGGGTVGEVRFRAPSGLDVAALSSAVGAPVREVVPGDYLVAAPSSPRLLAALTTWLADRDVALGDLRAGRSSLEDVFLRLTAPSSSSAEEAGS